MKKRVLIINYCLSLGGGEKLVYEMSKLCYQQKIKLTVLIPNKLEKEYYDDKLKEMGIKVVRIHIGSIKEVVKSRHMESIYWYFILRFFLNLYFNTVHIFNLSIANIYLNKINHAKRFIWHITNMIQYKNNKLPFNKNIFSNEKDTIVFINKYQLNELESQYGKIKTKIVNFKLFLLCD
ncbi:hypothetical protein ACTS93_11805 [Empedobacter falsenii]